MPTSTFLPEIVPPVVEARPWVAIVKDDPFDPVPPRSVVIAPGDTVAHVVARADFAPIAADYVAAFIDGEEVPREDWARIMPRPDQFLHLCVFPEGGGNGGKILTAALTVFVAALSLFLPGAVAFTSLVGGFGFTLTAGQIAAGVLVAGTLLINTLIPPPQLSARGQADPIARIDGAGNTFTPFQPIPLSIGRRRVFPSLGARGFQEVVGDDFFYRVLVIWGPKGIELENLRAGDTPLSNIDGVEVQHCLRDGDLVPTLYPGQVFQETIGATLISTTDWEGRRTIPGATSATLIYGFPAGLGRTTSRGRVRENSVQINTRWRQVTIDPVTLTESFGPWLPNASGLGRIFTAAQPGEPFFRSIDVSFPGAGIWDVETRRVDPDDDPDDEGIQDDIILQVLTSRRPGAPITRSDVAFSVFRFRATNETNGRIDTINADVSRLIPSFADSVLDQGDLAVVTAADMTADQRSSNPWEAILWMYRNGFEGRDPVPDEAINFASFAVAARHARDNGLSYDQWFRGEIEIEDAVAEAEFAGLGRAIFIGTQLTAVIDGPQIAPVLMFTERHVRNVRVAQSYPDQPDAFRVSWNDGADGDRDREDILYAPGQNASTARRFERLSIPGVTEWTALRKLIFRQFNNARLQQRRITVEVPLSLMDASARFGARVAFSASVISAGRAGGYVRDVVTGTNGNVIGVILDEPVELVPGDDLAVRFLRRRAGGDTVSAALRVTVPSEVTVTFQVTLETAVPSALAPQPGDLFAFGVLGSERMDGLLDRMEAVDEDWIRLNLVDYAPDRFDETGFVDVPRPPAIDLPQRRQPPALALVRVVADANNVAIHFQPVSGSGVEAVGFRAWRAAVAVQNEGTPQEVRIIGAFEALPSLSLTDRILLAPPGLAGERFVYRLAAIGLRGESGPLLEVNPVAASEALPILTGLLATSGTERIGVGLVRPVIFVEADPVLAYEAEYLVINLRRADNGNGALLSPSARAAYRQAAVVDADIARATLSGVLPGATYELQAYLRGARQQASLPITLPLVQVVDEEVVKSAQLAAGALPGGALEGELNGFGQRFSEIEDDLQSAQTQLNASVAQANTAAASAQTSVGEALARLDVLDENGGRIDQIETVAESEASRLNAVQLALNNGLSSVNAAVVSEASARQQGDQTIASNLNAVQLALNNDLSSVNAAVVSEASARQQGDQTIAANLNAVQLSLSNEIDTIEASVISEISARQQGDQTITQNLNALSNTTNGLSGSLNNLQTVVTNNNTARVTDITSLSARLTNTRPNLIPNSTGANGLTGWNNATGSWFVADFPELGRYIDTAGNLEPFIITPRFSVNTGQPYTYQGVLGGFGANNGFWVVAYFDASDQFLSFGQFRSVAFNVNYLYQDFTEVAPAGAVFARLQLGATFATSTHQYVISRLKAEPGAVASPWTDDALTNALAATTTLLQDVVFNADGQAAQFVIDASVPGAQVFARLSAINQNGQALGTVALGADVFAVLNPQNGVPQVALLIQDGRATYRGVLTALAGILVGSNQWPVALQSEMYAMLDGESVNFNYDFGAPVGIEMNTSELPALPSGQNYVVTVTNNDGTGFTLSAKRSVPGTPIEYTQDEDQSGASVGFARVANSVNANNASDGRYTFTVLLRVSAEASEQSASGQADLFIRNSSGAWLRVGVAAGSEPFSGDAAFFGGTTVDFSVTTTVAFGGDVINSGLAFAAHPSPGQNGVTVLDLTRVRYTFVPQDSVASATAGGQRVIVTVTPRNVLT